MVKDARSTHNSLLDLTTFACAVSFACEDGHEQHVCNMLTHLGLQCRWTPTTAAPNCSAKESRGKGVLMRSVNCHSLTIATHQSRAHTRADSAERLQAGQARESHPHPGAQRPEPGAPCRSISALPTIVKRPKLYRTEEGEPARRSTSPLLYHQRSYQLAYLAKD